MSDLHEEIKVPYVFACLLIFVLLCDIGQEAGVRRPV